MGWPRVDGGEHISPPNTSAAAVASDTTPADGGAKIIDIEGAAMLPTDPASPEFPPIRADLARLYPRQRNGSCDYGTGGSSAKM